MPTDSTARPAASQASKPPIMSVAWRKPIARSCEAAMLEE